MTQLMTISDMASFLQKSESWIYQNWRALQMPVVKVGGSLRIEKERLEKWVKARSEIAETRKRKERISVDLVDAFIASTKRKSKTK